jgi:hypothetical protein
MGTLKIICVAFQRPIHLRILIDCFLVQTDPVWELHIIHDGPAPEPVCKTIGERKDPRIFFSSTEIINGTYGHPNRRMALNDITLTSKDFVLMTNDDNYYVPEFVRYMRSQFKPNVGIIYNDCLHNYYSYDVLKSKLQINYIDMGSFVVRGSVAKKIGFVSNEYHADGIYCEQAAEYCNQHKMDIVYIPKAIFIHN